jgi:hypothetical protein
MNAVPIDTPSVLHLSPYLAGQAVEISALAWEARRHAQALAMVLERCASRPLGELVAQCEMAHAERRLADVVGILRTARERFETLPVCGGEAGE